MNEVPLATIALGHRNQLRVTWRPAGDDRSTVPVLELGRYRLADGQWSFVGVTVIRASNDVDELANGIAAGARLAATWRAEHGG